MKTRAFRIGAAFGGFLGIVIAFGMDKLSGDVPGGGWIGAVAHDFNLPPSSVAAILTAVLVVLMMVIISAGLGGLCGLALERFFKIFTQE
jgi:hypothetical protein